jgi:cell wall-associated NlpC family hydrolase
MAESNASKSLPSLAAIAIAAIFLIGLSSCANPFRANESDLANRSGETIGCDASFESSFFDGIYGFVLSNESFASSSKMRAAFEKSFREGRLKDFSEADRRRITDIAVEIYDLITEESLETLQTKDRTVTGIMEILTSIELGDQSTPRLQALHEKYRAKLSELNQTIERSLPPGVTQMDCPPPPTAPTPTPTPEPTPLPPGSSPTPTPTPAPPSLLDQWKVTRHPVVFGGLKSLAVAYQNCEAGKLSPLTSDTPDVRGITVVGTHSSGTGSLRVITDLTALLRTQPYLASYRKPASSCFDVLGKPMIYDYGGKPHATTATDSPLDFFRDAGSGTSELGIDCSGYVFSAIASGGLRVAKGKANRASLVYGINAVKYMNPQTTGLTCFNHATFQGASSLRPGDILASSGHVLLIDSVGNDPFGISRFTRESDCRSENISVARFDFTLLQSAPIKGGIGIDRIRAADYLTSGSMRTGMIQHAVNACLARTRNSSITTRSSSAELVRHSGTSDCQDRIMKLVREECLASCR